jgi:hypothetical protein
MKMAAQVSVRFCQDCFLLMNSFFVMVRMPHGSQVQLALASNLDSQLSWLNPKFNEQWAVTQRSVELITFHIPSAIRSRPKVQKYPRHTNGCRLV